MNRYNPETYVVDENHPPRVVHKPIAEMTLKEKSQYTREQNYRHKEWLKKYHPDKFFAQLEKTEAARRARYHLTHPIIKYNSRYRHKPTENSLFNT